MEATLMGDLWLFRNPNKDRRLELLKKEPFAEKLDELKRYMSDNHFKLIEVMNNKANYVARISIKQRTKIDCRMYRDIIVEMLEPYGLVKMVNEMESVK